MSFTSTVDDDRKPVPDKVNTVSEDPEMRFEGDIAVTAGDGLITVRADDESALTVVLPSITVTLSCAPTVSWEAGTIAVTCDGLTYVVASFTLLT